MLAIPLSCRAPDQNRGFATPEHESGRAADGAEHQIDSVNVVAEIPGNAKKDEIVMLGAHLDSWHGSAVVNGDTSRIAKR